MPVILFIPIFIVLFLVAVVVFIIWAAKNGGFSTKRDSKITLREGETPILATEIVWFRKSMYMNKNKIPRGVLDITDQRVVYTREFGEKYEFALEKNEIESVDYDGPRWSCSSPPMGLTICWTRAPSALPWGPLSPMRPCTGMPWNSWVYRWHGKTVLCTRAETVFGIFTTVF